MRILVVGAGAVGGYFGGRLLEKGEDVTFLVRERRKEELERDGLVIESVHGNAVLRPKTILEGNATRPFDVILLSTKAYHLQGAVESVRRYVGEHTVIIPLLNGLLHMDQLDEEFGTDQVVGGLCFVESTLDANKKIVQTSPIHEVVFGERNGRETERIQKIAKVFSGTKASFRLSENINQDMWHKYLFISVLSGITTLMRAPIGPIRDKDSGRKTIARLVNEIATIMRTAHAPIAADIETVLMVKIEELGYEMKSSMQRDMEKSGQVEADHLHGYLVEMAKKEQIQVPILDAVYANLKIYEQQVDLENRD